MCNDPCAVTPMKRVRRAGVVIAHETTCLVVARGCSARNSGRWGGRRGVASSRREVAVARLRAGCASVSAVAGNAAGRLPGSARSPAGGCLASECAIRAACACQGSALKLIDTRPGLD